MGSSAEPPYSGRMSARRFPVSRRAALIGLGALPLLSITAGLPRRGWAGGAASVDPTVELLATVFRLAGNAEYSDCRLPGYAESADTWFLPVRDHAVVKDARRLRKEHGVSYDAVISLAVHLRPDLSLRVPAAGGLPDLDPRWPRDQLPAFLEALRDFASTSKPAEFLEAKAATLERIDAGVAGLRGRLDGAWLETFFGVTPDATYRVIASPMAGPGNYGATLTVGGQQEIVSVLGVWEFGHDGLPTFGDASLATLVHETSHSFINPLVAAREAAFAPPFERIFPWVADRMATMAYGTWQTVLAESLVRASVVRYLAAHDELAVDEEIERQEKRGFSWIEPLSEALERYEGDRKKWPTLAAFVPELASFFDRYGRGFETKMKALSAARPQVTAVSPANGSTGVDPGLAAITVRFDRPMKNQSWSVVGSPADLPRLGTLVYDADRTTLTIPVTMQPGRTYTVRLNSERFTGFQSADGAPLAPWVWTFSTR